MAKIKLKIIKIFFRLRKLLVVFGLILSVSLFYLSIPVSAAEASLSWGLTSCTITQGSDVIVGNSTWDSYAEGDDYQFYHIITDPYASSFSPGYYTLHAIVYFPALMNNTISFTFLPSFTYSYHSSSVGFSSTPYNFVPVVSNASNTDNGWQIFANTPQNYTVGYMEFRFNFMVPDSPQELWSFLAWLNANPYTPISSAEESNFPSPDSGTVDEFDEIESGLAEDSADQFEEGYSWLMGFQRFLNNTWTLQALSGITKFINYLTGQESMNGHVYADWDYFMKPLFFALAIGILPFILGIPLRFLRSGSKK